jgi:hypothetical protein
MDSAVFSSYISKAEELEEYRKKGTLPTHEAELAELYMGVCGKHIRECNCKDRWSDALIEIRITLNKIEKMNMAGTKYRLRVGVVLHDFEKNESYTNANLTDKIAKEYLKKYPQQAELFEVIPQEPKKKNADTDVEDTEPSKAEEETKDVEEPKKNADTDVEDTEPED